MVPRMNRIQSWGEVVGAPTPRSVGPRGLLLVALLIGVAGCARAPEPDDSDHQALRARNSQGDESTMTAGMAASAMGGPGMTASPMAPSAMGTGPARVNDAGDLLHPTGDLQAPATYAVEMQTDAGPIIIDVTRAWSPNGADRFYTLVRLGYFTDVAFFRVIQGFMAQAGIHGDPAVNRVWRDRNIMDDPAADQSNTRGMITFAKTGMPNSRSTQFFINFGNNANLDRMGFTPFGRVRDMTAVDAIYSGYGEGAPRGRGPNQGTLQSQGNTYLQQSYPEMTYIRSARIVQ